MIQKKMIEQEKKPSRTICFMSYKLFFSFVVSSLFFQSVLFCFVLFFEEHCRIFIFLRVFFFCTLVDKYTQNVFVRMTFSFFEILFCCYYIKKNK